MRETFSILVVFLIFGWLCFKLGRVWDKTSPRGGELDHTLLSRTRDR